MRNKSNLPGVLVVAGSILLMFAMWGMGNHPLGLYVVPITAAYGFSRTSFSVVFSIINLCNALGCLFFGTALKKLGLRRLMICGAALGILGYALLAAASDLAVFYIASAVFGIALAMTTNNPISQLINNWFLKKRGVLLGLVFAASGIGGSVCDVIAGRLLEEFGFRHALWLTAIIITALLVMGLALVWQDDPSRKGLLPYGYGSAEERKNIPAYGLSFEEAKKTPSFWLLLCMEMFWGMAIIPIITSVPAHLSDQGIAASAVSNQIMPVLFAVSAVSKLGMGFVYDRFGPKTMLAVIGICTTAGAALLPRIHDVPGAMMMALLIGGGYACMTIPAPLLTERIFGNRAYAAILSPVTAIMSLAGAVGTPVSNAVCDITGSYNAAYCCHAAMFAAAAVCGICALRLAKPHVRKHET